jgi:hypothetical protein
LAGFVFLGFVLQQARIGTIGQIRLVRDSRQRGRAKSGKWTSSMTLVVAMNGPETIWLLADRRLSLPSGRVVRDDGCKVMLLEATDGVAILGYAGLGATAQGTEPSDWMSAVLRGRNLPLEQSLGVLAEAMKKQLPRHMARMPGPAAHDVIVPAFLGKELRLYSIDLAFAPDRKWYFRYTRHVETQPSAPPREFRVAIGGSGALRLIRDRAEWTRNKRSLFHLIKACDRGRLSPYAVADRLAHLNNAVHLVDRTVGPRCMVVWRHRKGGVHKGGGAHQFYCGTTRETSTAAIPNIGAGRDVRAIINAMMPHMLKNLEAMRAGQPALNDDEMKAEFARLPYKPDEDLR